MLVPIKLTYCRNGQLIWLEGHFEKYAFSGWINGIICQYWVHCARCTLQFQDNNRRGTENIHRLSRQVPQRRVSGGPHLLIWSQSKWIKQNGTQKRQYSLFVRRCTLSSESIQWDKQNLTHFSSNFRFEDFSWTIPQAAENAVASNMLPACL